MEIPSYLGDYREQYEKDPRRTAVRWFREAEFGLFLHYGLYSLLGRGEWVQLREKIPVAEYEKLKDRFTAEKFDAELIADLALDAGMKYVNITTRHHDSFCLFRTEQTDFNSVSAPCGRDLVGELAAACEKRGLGLCLYYSHGRDWKHPHAPNNDQYGGNARPEYDPPEASYATGAEHDLQIYLDFMSAQITELLSGYGPIAAIWLDGIMTPLEGDAAAFGCQELYDRIHALQPQVLVSYKQMLLGTEDFAAPENESVDTRGKPGEICTTLGPRWGYVADAEDKHLDAEAAWEKLRYAGRSGFNLLLNTGPMSDGAIEPVDARTLRQVGARLRKEGFPA